jgi:hypothetical protein
VLNNISSRTASIKLINNSIARHRNAGRQF